MAAYDFQAKKINADALNQITDWYDRTGKHYLISNMTQRHCHGAMKKLFSQFGGKAATSPLFLALQAQAIAQF